jgi:hypothetical protein
MTAIRMGTYYKSFLFTKKILDHYPLIKQLDHHSVIITASSTIKLKTSCNEISSLHGCTC